MQGTVRTTPTPVIGVVINVTTGGAPGPSPLLHTPIICDISVLEGENAGFVCFRSAGKKKII